MVFGLLVMFTALCISAVAIYYSVAGLAAIFAAAVIPIIIMGGVLEVSKLVPTQIIFDIWLILARFKITSSWEMISL